MDFAQGLLVLIFIASVLLFCRRRLRLPPGPKGLPILGHVFGMPKSHEWLQYAKWSRQYGAYSNILSTFAHAGMLGSDIIHLKLAGTRVFVLNSAEAAIELFDKRSSSYSDRLVVIHTYGKALI